MKMFNFKLIKFNLLNKYAFPTKLYKLQFRCIGDIVMKDGGEQGITAEEKEEVERKLNFFRREELMKPLIKNEELDQIPKFKPVTIDQKLAKRTETLSRRANNKMENRQALYANKLKIVNEIEKLLMGKQYLLSNDLVEEHIEDLSLNHLLLGDKKDLKDYKSLYIIPLTNDEIKLTKKIFDPITSEKIICGGKEVLINELIDKVGSNKEETNNIKLLFDKLKDYSRITKEEVEYLKENYPQVLENKILFKMCHNIGSSFINSLKKLQFFNKQKLASIKSNLSSYEMGSYIKMKLSNHQKAIYKSKINEKQINEFTSPFILEALKLLNYDQKKMFIDLINNKEFKNLANIENYNFRISNISMIKGLSADKMNNFTNLNYEIQSVEDSIKVYEVIDSNTGNKDNFDNDYSEFRIILRVTLEFQSKTPNQDNLYETHYALFNNELEMPSNKVHLGLINYPELLNFYNIGNWQLVDVDNSKLEDHIRLTQSCISYLIQDVIKSHNFYFDENIAKYINITYNNYNYFTEYDDKIISLQIKNKLDNKSKVEEKADVNKKDKKEKDNKEKVAKEKVLESKSKLNNKYILRNIQDLSQFDIKINSLFKNRDQIIEHFENCRKNYNLMIFSYKLSILLEKTNDEIYFKFINFLENLKKYEENSDSIKFKSVLSEYESLDPCGVVNYSQVSFES